LLRRCFGVSGALLLVEEVAGVHDGSAAAVEIEHLRARLPAGVHEQSALVLVLGQRQ
jgi:hypothetical protein